MFASTAVASVLTGITAVTADSVLSLVLYEHGFSGHAYGGFAPEMLANAFVSRED